MHSSKTPGSNDRHPDQENDDAAASSLLGALRDRVKDIGFKGLGIRAWETVMAPGNTPEQAGTATDDIASRARTTAPIVWLLGKVQSGKSSIVKALTGCEDVAVGDGYKACTRTSSLFEFPPEAPIVRFLDTRGLGEIDYNPAPDIAFCDGQAHLLLVVMKAMDGQQGAVVDALTAARRTHPGWPILVAQTCLHEGYRAGADHAQPYPFSDRQTDRQKNSGSGSSANIPASLARALAFQRTLFDGLPGGSVPTFVPLDFTLDDDGFTPQLYGLDPLLAAIGRAAPLGLMAHLRDLSAQQGGKFSARTHPHILGYAGAAAAVDVMPVAGLVAVPGVQAKMLHSIASIYGAKWDRRLWLEFSGSLGAGAALRLLAGFGARELAKLVPVYGQTIGTASAAAASFATTFALGKAACYFLEQKLNGRGDPQGVAEAYKKGLLQAFELVREKDTPGS